MKSARERESGCSRVAIDERIDRDARVQRTSLRGCVVLFVVLTWSVYRYESIVGSRGVARDVFREREEWEGKRARYA